MSGHSKWSSIKRAKGATDAKKGAIFTKLSKNISLAAKNGKDPSMNSALRTAIDAAKAANMPKDNIERAILRGAGELPGQLIEELTYECYGPGGVAIMIRCSTDNTNRTATFIKTTLSKAGGNLGGPGTVNYLFQKKGIVRIEKSADELQLIAMDAGADDIVEEDDGLTIYTSPETLDAVKDAMGDDVELAEIHLVPLTKVNVSKEEDKGRIEKLLSDLEENEDIDETYHNAEL
ncbi:MAG: YebC/PmpR family DNA-binding transcriptional regulator [bacterium]|nr:YebC/PmpR family DNA-binding transcriptional regulator [bacterium]